MELNFFLLFLIFTVACLYSMVGHGGASGYLALMTLLGVSLITAKPIALSLNILVSCVAFIQYARHGYFDKKIFFTLIITSVPCAYLGGRIHISTTLYMQLLGIALLLTAVRFIFPFKQNTEETKPSNPFILLTLGASIGFISGILGIGGGIILSPILIFLSYSSIKTTSGISALFIFVNSIAGLLALIQKGIMFDNSMIYIICIAGIGGLIGSYLGVRKINHEHLKRILALVLFIASIKLIFV